MANGWFTKCENHMNYEIHNILKLEDKNIQSLWNVNSEFSIFDSFIRISKTEKTLKMLSKKFVIIIDNENQFFV